MNKANKVGSFHLVIQDQPKGNVVFGLPNHGCNIAIKFPLLLENFPTTSHRRHAVANLMAMHLYETIQRAIETWEVVTPEGAKDSPLNVYLLVSQEPSSTTEFSHYDRTYLKYHIGLLNEIIYYLNKLDEKNTTSKHYLDFIFIFYADLYRSVISGIDEVSKIADSVVKVEYSNVSIELRDFEEVDVYEVKE